MQKNSVKVMTTTHLRPKKVFYKRFLIIILGIFLYFAPLANANTDNIQHANLVITQPDTKQVDCLTKALYWEVRQPSEQEMELVASVIMTRTQHSKYPSNVCGVVLEKGQFQYVDLGLHNTEKTIQSSKKNPTEMKALLLARKTAREFLTGYKKPIIKSIAYISNKIKKPKSKFWNRLVLERKSELHSFYLSSNDK